MTGRHVELGCLCIDEIASGSNSVSGLSHFQKLPGIETWRFAVPPGEKLWDSLQVAWQQLRERCEACGIMAWGTGCAGALALAEQLPVERMVLFEPRLSVNRPGDGRVALFDSGRRQARRLAAFARANLPLCVCDMLIVESEQADAGQGKAVGRLAVHSRVSTLSIRGEIGGNMYTIREIVVKQAISCFLHAGEWQKPLAENPEMCIIDG